MTTARRSPKISITLPDAAREALDEIAAALALPGAQPNRSGAIAWLAMQEVERRRGSRSQKKDRGGS